MKTKKTLLSFGTMLFVALTALALVVACGKDNGAVDNDPIDTAHSNDRGNVNPYTDSNYPDDVFPPICFEDSVWITRDYYPDFVVCYAPIDSEWVYCYFRSNGRYHCSFEHMAQNGYKYKYYYCDDASDSAYIREQYELYTNENVDYLVDEMAKAPHVCFTESMSPEGEVNPVFMGMYKVIHPLNGIQSECGLICARVFLSWETSLLSGMAMKKTKLGNNN